MNISIKFQKWFLTASIFIENFLICAFSEVLCVYKTDGGDFIKSYEDVEKMFDTYCRRVLKNKLIDYKRAEKRRRNNEISFAVLPDIGTEDEILIGVINVGNKRCEIRNDELYRALMELPEENCNIILLYYFFDMTDLEISVRLGQKRTAVRNKRYRTLVALQKLLEDENERIR